MLPKHSRLPPSEFNARGYRTVRTPAAALKIKRNTFSENRIGVVVGAAAVKKAVRRNVLKRQAKNFFLRKEMQRNMDILVIFSSRAASLTKAQLCRELGDAYAAAGKA